MELSPAYSLLSYFLLKKQLLLYFIKKCMLPCAVFRLKEKLYENFVQHTKNFYKETALRTAFIKIFHAVTSAFIVFLTYFTGTSEAYIF